MRREKCRRFQYGGCEGNENNFETLRECNDICGSNDKRLYGYNYFYTERIYIYSENI